MSESLRRKPTDTSSVAPTALRDTLFGDLPLEVWGKDNDEVPWRFFAEARRACGAGDDARAVAAMRSVLTMPGLESRHYLQAWHVLRRLGQSPPPEEAKRVLGVVFEVAMESDASGVGLDLLAAYADGSARYYNFAGGGVVADAPSPEAKELVEQLLAAASDIVRRIGPWEKERPPAPPAGSIRMSFLTPSGIHFGQGDIGIMSREAMAGPVITIGTRLMQALMSMGARAER